MLHVLSWLCMQAKVSGAQPEQPAVDGAPDRAVDGSNATRGLLRSASRGGSLGSPTGQVGCVLPYHVLWSAVQAAHLWNNGCSMRKVTHELEQAPGGPSWWV